MRSIDDKWQIIGIIKDSGGGRFPSHSHRSSSAESYGIPSDDEWRGGGEEGGGRETGEGRREGGCELMKRMKR